MQTHKSTRIDKDAHTKRTRKEEGAQHHDALLLPHSKVLLGLQVPVETGTKRATATK